MKREIRLTSGKKDTRSMTVKEVETLPQEEQEILKRLLLASIQENKTI